MSYQRKILVGLMLAIGAFLPVVGLSLYTVHKLIVDEGGIIEANARRTLLIERLQFFNSTKNSQIPVYILTRDPAHLDSFYEYHRLFNSTLEEILKLEEDPENRVLLQELKRDSDAAFGYLKPGIQMVVEGKSILRVHRYFRSTTMPLNKEVVEVAQKLAQQAARHEARGRERMNKTVLALEEAIGGLAILAIVLAAWATFLIMKVSRQKRLVDQQTERTSRARKEIVEIVSHDLKSPLATIQMTTELMLEEIPRTAANVDCHQGLAMIKRSCQAMSRLIADLLDHAKIESGNMMLETQSCEMDHLVKNVAERFLPLAQAKKIHFVTDIDDAEIISICDAGRMDQALSNLLSNAIKFTSENGQVKLSCQKSAREVLISVQDSGPGLSDDQIPHIFDRYWQVRKAGQQGTGLGLAIVKSIIDAHHGHIWVESQPQQGAKFCVSLPI